MGANQPLSSPYLFMQSVDHPMVQQLGFFSSPGTSSRIQTTSNQYSRLDAILTYINPHAGKRPWAAWHTDSLSTYLATDPLCVFGSNIRGSTRPRNWWLGWRITQMELRQRNSRKDQDTRCSLMFRLIGISFDSICTCNWQTVWSHLFCRHWQCR